ncbi:MAG: hypothetical protein JXR96_23110 [Deltaproteobacteria bacterium]|nr:hypothetical protein [Deltaproteobacteria bacterium]
MASEARRQAGWLVLLAAVCLQAPESAARSRQPDTGKRRCKVYVYLDAEGRPIKTRDLQAVPASERSQMLTYTDDCKERFGSTAVQAAEAAERVEADDEPGAAGVAIPDNWRRSRRSCGWWRWIFGLCAILVIAGTIGVVIEAFRTSILWGLAVLFIPVVWLIFSILAWDRVKLPFLAGALGYLGMFGAMFAAVAVRG